MGGTVLEQQYLLADLADALEAKGLVQGQVYYLWGFPVAIDGDVFLRQRELALFTLSCGLLLYKAQVAGLVEVHEWAPLEQQYLLADVADALEAKGLVQGQVCTLVVVPSVGIALLLRVVMCFCI
jgi:hypothetical protein